MSCRIDDMHGNRNFFELEENRFSFELEQKPQNSTRAPFEKHKNYRQATYKFIPFASRTPNIFKFRTKNLGQKLLDIMQLRLGIMKLMYMLINR